MRLTVLFVCPHGAAKSRMAAAYFNELAGPGWQATSAGTEPQEAVSVHPARLLQGQPAHVLLDHEPPRPVSDVPEPTVVVAIDCQASALPGAIRWELENREFDEAMRDEIQARVDALAKTLAAQEPA